MANEKNTRKSAFNAPTIGIEEKIPKGHVAKMDKDAVVHYVKRETKKKTK